MKQLGIGIIGAGRIARVHAEAYKAVAGGKLIAVAESEPLRLEAFSREYHIEPYRSYQDLLRHPGVDAVVIATPNWLHTEMALAAAAAGKHVFCQKPLALTVEETDAIIAATKKAGVLLQVGFMLRFTPPMQEVKTLVAGGGLGDIIALRAAVFGWEPSADWFYDKSKGGGVILDTMIHFADLLIWLVGGLREVHALGGAYVLEGAKRHRSPDNASVQFRHGNGASSQIYVSWTTGYGDFLYEIYGSRGTISVNFLERQITSVFFKDTPRVKFHDHAAGWNRLNLQWPAGYAGEAQYFVDQVRGSAPAGNASGEDARAALIAALAAQESLDTGRVVQVEARP
jgi:myo-inositol 2-dehydrogenase/D-chiro-inositol 1-dehydrogenase